VTTSARADIALHEASHAVASWMLNRRVDFIESGNAAGRCSTYGADLDTRRDIEDEIVIALAGYEASGVPSEADDRQAVELAKRIQKTPDGVLEILAKSHARTKALVHDRRFERLSRQLGAYIADERRPVVSGDLAFRLLTEWDNGGSVEVVQVGPKLWEVRSRGRTIGKPGPRPYAVHLAKAHGYRAEDSETRITRGNAFIMIVPTAEKRKP
jgi:hypothetical protein